MGTLLWDADRGAYTLLSADQLDDKKDPIHLVGGEEAFAHATKLIGTRVAVAHHSIAMTSTGDDKNTVAHVVGIRPFPST